MKLFELISGKGPSEIATGIALLVEGMYMPKQSED